VYRRIALDLAFSVHSSWITRYFGDFTEKCTLNTGKKRVWLHTGAVCRGGVPTRDSQGKKKGQKAK
jgi:hypothetical protein